MTQITIVPLHRVGDNPYQTRQTYSAIPDLALKIKRLKAELADTLGLIHPPRARLVELAADGHAVERVLPPVYPPQGVESWAVQLVEGHRRKRAFELLARGDEDAGLDADPDYDAIPLMLGEFDDQTMDDIAWDENAARRNLSSVEEARALQRTMETFGLTQADLAERRKLARSTITNKLRLLRLPIKMQQAIHKGRLSERHGIAYLPMMEIAPADLEEARSYVNNNRDFGDWSAPTPQALLIRLVEDANLTADQVRKAVERTKQAIARAKRQTAEVSERNARDAQERHEPSAPAPSRGAGRSRMLPPSAPTRVGRTATAQPSAPIALDMPPKVELKPNLPEVVITIRVTQEQGDEGSPRPKNFTLSIGAVGVFPSLKRGEFPELLETVQVAVDQFFNPPQPEQEILLDMEIDQ